jgi:adenylate kinase family enzyme
MGSVQRLTALILGPPGGGKGTISKKLLKDFNFLHLSTGDVLRRHVQNQTAVGKAAQTYMIRGSYAML